MDPYDAAVTLALAQDIEPISKFYQSVHHFPKLHRKLDTPPYPGTSFFFRGHLSEICESFFMNFLLSNEYEDIALHISARLPQNYIVRNTRLRRRWGFEESAAMIPFRMKRGRRFLIQVLVTHEMFYISVNSFHFATYQHRISYEHIKAVEMGGDIRDVKMDHYYISEYPCRLPISLAQDIKVTDEKAERVLENVPVWLRLTTNTRWLSFHSQNRTELLLPYYGRLTHRSLVMGRALRIEGRVHILPVSFVIDLQTGQDIWPQPDVAFRFSPTFLRATSSKFGGAMVYRSSFQNGHWSLGEKSHLETSLAPGKSFILMITCTTDAFEVYVNKEFLVVYKYHMDPMRINMVRINGDIKLFKVRIQSSDLKRSKIHIQSKIFKGITSSLHIPKRSQ